ncbi:hypothetical protein EJB05_08948, partial [Eragrostis curvula]
MGRPIRSAIFKVGGYDWALCYYPEGTSFATQAYVGVALELITPYSENVGTDVSFDVQGVKFDAHKIILAMRSPVFKAELYGSMMETRMQLITIADMQPVVFKALLHFIYTDSLNIMDDHEGEDITEMVKHLLVASDRSK